MTRPQHDEGRVCPCVKSHKPEVVELNRHHILPLYLGGPDVEGNIAWICPNTHVAVHELLRIYMKLDATPPVEIVEQYPKLSRVLAAEGYRRWKASLV